MELCFRHDFNDKDISGFSSSVDQETEIMSLNIWKGKLKHLIHLVDKLLNNFPADIRIIHLGIH